MGGSQLRWQAKTKLYKYNNAVNSSQNVDYY